MAETIITILVVAAAGIWLFRRLWASAKGKGGCGCGKSHCDRNAAAADSCQHGNSCRDNLIRKNTRQ